MWTIFKVFTEFVTILLWSYVLGFWLRGTWDLSCLIRGQTCTPALEGGVLTVGPRGKLLGMFSWLLKSMCREGKCDQMDTRWCSSSDTPFYGLFSPLISHFCAFGCWVCCLKWPPELGMQCYVGLLCGVPACVRLCWDWGGSVCVAQASCRHASPGLLAVKSMLWCNNTH